MTGVEIFKGYFVTKDGRTQTVDEFTNLARSFTFVYRRKGIVTKLPLIDIKALTDLGSEQIRITRRNGEILSAQMWNIAGGKCMVFSYLKAEWSVYVNELDYSYYDQCESKRFQSEISLCDIKEIVFD
jgi:hypothetical protein